MRAKNVPQRQQTAIPSERGYKYVLVTQGHSAASYRFTGALWLNGTVGFEPADSDTSRQGTKHQWQTRLAQYKKNDWDDKTIFHYLTKQGHRLGIHCSEPADALDLDEIRQQIRRILR